MKGSIAFLAGALWIVGISSAFAEAQILAERGQAVTWGQLEVHAWPPEALELMAHPSREVIWKNTDDGKFGDRVMIAFRPKNQKEVDEVLAIFAKTDVDYHRITLQPEKEPARFVARYPKSFRGCSMMLSVRSPKALQAWYEALPINADGLRYSPLQVFTEPPQAGSQSLTIFAGNESINLEAISWPEWTVLGAGTSEEMRKESPDAPIVVLIDRFASRYSLPNCMERRARRAIENARMTR